MDSQKVKIGLREVTAMPAHSLLWDTDLKGFCVRRGSGATTYSVVFREGGGGKQRWLRIGRHFEIDVAGAHRVALLEAIDVLRVEGVDLGVLNRDLRGDLGVDKLAGLHGAVRDIAQLVGGDRDRVRGEDGYPHRGRRHRQPRRLEDLADKTI